MPSVQMFDCFAIYGPYPGKPVQARWRLGDLLDDLDLAGIAGALTQYTQGTAGDPMRANLKLSDDIREHRDRLFPCWTALPAIAGAFPDTDTFMHMMEDQDVRAVRIAPEAFGIPRRETLWGSLRDALASRQMPVLMQTTCFTQDLSPIEEMLEIFRHTDVILTGHCWHQWRWVEYLMTRYPRLHIEFSSFQANRAPEVFAANYGIERCLFGTGLMDKAPGAARGFLDWSLLPGPDVAAIAGGNLRRLLKGSGPRRDPSPSPWQDALTNAARNGRPLPCEIWDNHCHILHDGTTCAGGRMVFHKGDADGMIEITRKVGITRTAIMSWEGPASYDTDLGNETVARAVDRYPDEFIGLASIDPTHQTPAEIENVIKTYHLGRRFPGLKFLRHDNLNYDDPLFDRWYHFGSLHKLYAVIDPCSRQDGDMIANLVRKFPDLRISLDHCGQSWPYAVWAADMVRRYPNVDAQLTYTSVTNGVIEFLVEACGPDRVMFGTDAPMRDPRPQVGWLVFTRLAERDKRLVFGENFKRRLGEIEWGAPTEHVPAADRS